MTLEELLEKYVEYNNRANPAEIAAFNKIKEEIGEHIADLAVAEKFGLEAQARAVPRRGVKGAPVLDRVYELAPSKYLYAEEGAFIIADAKFGESDLARSHFKRRFLVEGGKMTPLPARFQITQLDPDWIRERIREVARREAEAAAQQGVTLTKSLADDLDRAAREDRLRIIEVRGSLDLQNGQVVGINGEIVDHTQEFYDRYLSGRRPPIDKEGRLARQESLHRLYLNRAAIKARGTQRRSKGRERNWSGRRESYRKSRKNYRKPKGPNEKAQEGAGRQEGRRRDRETRVSGRQEGGQDFGTDPAAPRRGGG